MTTVIAGCDKKPEANSADDKQAADGKQDKADEPKPDEPVANFAEPKTAPPPAPEGAITLEDPWLYVQTCAPPNPCPELLQPAGDAHCRELTLGNADGWRLPSKDEVPRFQGVAGLEQTAGYHWTRTPDDENMSMVWIVDPSGEGPVTTILRERKPFRIRCVKEP
jgi:hypothetical protein